MRTIALTLASLAVLLAAAPAHAETSIYVAEQPGLSLILKAEGGDVYATYLRAEILCYGAGGYWYEGATTATHRAFLEGPVKLRRHDDGLRLVDKYRGPFDSSREIIEGKVRSDSFTGTFSYFASGEGIGGKCEANAPEFEPEFGEREPPVSFEARRYVPLGSLLETAPNAAAEDLYFAHSKALEIYLSVAGEAVGQVRGTASLKCANRKGMLPTRRQQLGFDPPYALSKGRSFDAREAYDYGFRGREAQITGTIAAGEVAGALRIVGFNRSHDRERISSRCLTGPRGGDGYLGYRARRYLPVEAGG